MIEWAILIVMGLLFVMLLWYYLQPYYPIYVIRSSMYEGSEPVIDEPIYYRHYYNAIIHHPIDGPLLPYLTIGEYRPVIIVTNDDGIPLVTLTTIPVDDHYPSPQRGYPIVTDDYAIVPQRYYRHAVMKAISYPRANYYWGRPLIPPLLHQSSDTLVVPHRVKTATKSWRRHHPTSIYYYHTSQQNRDLLRRFSPNVLAAYQPGLIPLLCQLYWKGGLGAAINVECIRSLDPLLATHDLIIVLDSQSHSLHPSLMASVSGHIFVRRLISALVTDPPLIDDIITDYISGSMNTPAFQSSGSYLHPDGTRYYLLHYVSTTGTIGDQHHIYSRIYN